MAYTSPNPNFLKNKPGTDSSVIAAELRKIESHLSPRSTTIVVAASDSSAKSKAQADYVCDGTADNVEIQEAIDELPTTGGKILLEDGSFRITSAFDFSNAEYAWFSGSGPCSKIISSGSNHIISAINQSKKNGLHISDMFLSGGGVNVGGDGIHLSNVSNFTLDNLHIENCGSGYDGAGIFAEYADNGQICNNFVYSCRNGYLNSQMEAGHVYNVRIENNHFENSTDDDIHTQRGKNNLVIGNICIGAGDDGIDTWGEQNTIIMGNQVLSDNTGHGIEIGDVSTGCIVNGNYVEGSKGINICLNGVDKISVLNNTIVNAADIGIFVNNTTEGSSHPTNISLKSNTIISPINEGIKITSGANHEITGNRIITPGGHGVYIKGDVCTVENNYIQTPVKYGILAITASNLLLTGNYCNGSSAATRDGIRIQTSTNVHVIDNYSINNAGHGVYVVDDSSDITVVNNCVAPNTLGSIRPGTGARNKTAGNVGYATKNTGTATITAGQTSIVVTHGLAATPTNVIVTPRGNVGSVWADTFTTTQFTIHCSTAPGADTVVGWSAVV
jgi:hypothetical protein